MQSSSASELSRALAIQLSQQQYKMCDFLLQLVSDYGTTLETWALLAGNIPRP